MLLPAVYDLITYGPVKASLVGSESYTVGDLSSPLIWSMYSEGTGAVTGIVSALASVGAKGLVSLNTSVVSSGVWMPAIGPPLALSAPSMSLK